MISSKLWPNFQRTLLSGQYNILFGSGISLDSQNHLGESLRSAANLCQDLCTLVGAPKDTSLSRVSALLTPDQISDELTNKYSGCQPGTTISYLSKYLWRRIFTFNIDDVIENQYKNCTDGQRLLTVNFPDPFFTTQDRSSLQLIHLHGYVNQPDTGYVFSIHDYTKVMIDNNPWMHFLAEILATEPFIIAGTSLNENDLEFFLRGRNELTARRDSAPSLLIEPNNNVIIENDCKRYDLVHIQSTLGDFFNWLSKRIPHVPTIYELITPTTSQFFNDKISNKQVLSFFCDFEAIETNDEPLPQTPSAFLYGNEPTWREIGQHLDIQREDNSTYTNFFIEQFNNNNPKSRKDVILILDDAGTGKSTILKRIANNLVKLGHPIVTIKTLSRINTTNAIECLTNLNYKILIIADGVADHANELCELLDSAAKNNIIILGSERSYRKEYVQMYLGKFSMIEGKLTPFSETEYIQLINRYNDFGLTGEQKAAQQPEYFAKLLRNDPVAVGICRILNDFKPLERIIKSLWKHTNEDLRFPFLCVALAEYCYKGGLRYSLLQNIVGPKLSLKELFNITAPLSFSHSDGNGEFIVTRNGVIGERILFFAVQNHFPKIQQAFLRIATSLAPYVNRRTIMRRTPDARLPGRLFDADKIVRPLLNEYAKTFYIDIQDKWQWNSRYWEQRALLTSEDNIDEAIQYARHAVAIEKHPFPLTTLGKILLKKLQPDDSRLNEYFNEAFEHLSNAIDIEDRSSRVTVHPYGELLSGSLRYVDHGGIFTAQQMKLLRKYIAVASQLFRQDKYITGLLPRLSLHL